MPETPQESGQAERRRRERVKTSRQAMFSAFDRGLLGQGTVVDVSADGMQIHSRMPQEVGRELDVDIYPKYGSGEQVLHARVRVAHLRSLGNGEWAMGLMMLSKVPLEMFTPQVGAMPVRMAPKPPAPELLPEPGPAALPEAPVSRGMPVPESAAAESEALAVILFREAAARPVNRRQLALLAALLFCLCCLLFRACHPIAPAREGGNSPSPRNASQRASSALDQVYALLELGQSEEARRGFADLARNASYPPPERFIARLGEAEAALASGKRDLALELLAGLERTPGAPAPWLHAARQFARRIEQREKGNTGPITAMRMPLPIAPPETAPGTDAPAMPPLRIVVDKSEHALEILRDGKTVAAFPVGLGQNNATPEGQFRISAKILNPDWNDHGRKVKSGDPENPLGGQWLGLENQSGPTPYGIHPTEDSASIGQDKSRGCIRVRPEDARQIYRLCPVGTPVTIRP